MTIDSFSGIFLFWLVAVVLVLLVKLMVKGHELRRDYIKTKRLTAAQRKEAFEAKVPRRMARASKEEAEAGHMPRLKMVWDEPTGQMRPQYPAGLDINNTSAMLRWVIGEMSMMQDKADKAQETHVSMMQAAISRSEANNANNGNQHQHHNNKYDHKPREMKLYDASPTEGQRKWLESVNKPPSAHEMMLYAALPSPRESQVKWLESVEASNAGTSPGTSPNGHERSEPEQALSSVSASRLADAVKYRGTGYFSDAVKMEGVSIERSDPLRTSSSPSVFTPSVFTTSVFTPSEPLRTSSSVAQALAWSSHGALESSAVEEVNQERVDLGSLRQSQCSTSLHVDLGCSSASGYGNDSEENFDSINSSMRPESTCRTRHRTRRSSSTKPERHRAGPSPRTRLPELRHEMYLYSSPPTLAENRAEEDGLRANADPRKKKERGVEISQEHVDVSSNNFRSGSTAHDAVAGCASCASWV